MRIWTVLDKKQYKKLLKSKCLQAEEKFVQKTWHDMPNFHHSYQWMMKKMKEANIDIKGISSPMWAWVKRPDFRDYRYTIPKGDEAYLIEIEIDRKDILITCFHSWWFVLSGFFFVRSNKDEKEFFKKFNIDSSNAYYWDNKYFNNNNQEKKLTLSMKKEILSSWDRIIPKKLNKNDHYQACYKEIKIENVKSIKKYIGASKYSN